MSGRLSKTSKNFKAVSWLALLALPTGFSPLAHAAEAPGGITIVITDQVTDRPLANAQITITERENNSTQSLQSDAQGRIALEQLDPGLYSVKVAKKGYAISNEPSVRVLTRKNIQIEFELLRDPTGEEVLVTAQRADASASHHVPESRDAHENARAFYRSVQP